MIYTKWSPPLISPTNQMSTVAVPGASECHSRLAIFFTYMRVVSVGEGRRDFHHIEPFNEDAVAAKKRENTPMFGF